jgi:glutathione reductase (NADPH)
MATTVDVIVIGTGSAAQSVAYTVREAGRSVAVIDSRPFGGTCQLRGCDPKKVLVGVSELVDWSHRMQGNGVSGPALSINWPELIRFKRSFTDPAPHENEQAFAQAGIPTRHGRARFVDRTTVEVGGETLAGRHVVVAGGARHATLGIPGEDQLTTSTQFLELDRLPRRILFVGGGYIAFEFAHVAARAGAEVRVLHRGSRPLQKFDPDLVAMLVETTRALGVGVGLNTEVVAIERQADHLVVHAQASGHEQAFEADMVVHAAGRVPEIDDLNLEVAGVVRTAAGVSVNEYLQSVSNPAVYAAGDAVASGGFPLTPVAGMQGAIVASNLLKGNHGIPNYAGIPSVVFTTPTLARVGLTEEAAHAEGLRFATNHGDTSDWYTSRRVGLRHTGFKTLVEEGTGRILGAHLLGQHAEEVINLFGLAIRTGIRASDLKHAVFAYPTSASDLSSML